jgi:lipopolysaccharide/colanic/teichoic acid biosynthesis glycosyltransferase
MRIAWAFLMGFIGILATAVIGDLFSEEIRTRLERLPATVIRFAGRRLPADIQDEWTDEWLAELAFILRGTESLPITRLVRGARFAVGHLRSAPAIGRDLAKADEGMEAMAEALGSQRMELAAKRAIDIVLATLMLLAAAPMLAAIALAIRLSSPGPVLFRQVRVGRGGTPFTMLKFRTMHVANDDSIHRAYVTAMLTGAADVVDGGRGIYMLNDPRVTPLGRMLRRASLDELPQLLNVLRGDMSLVGPRPVLPREAKLFEPRHQVRFAVRPGLTGLWQVRGRNALTMQQVLDRDVQYVRERKLLVDLLMLARTIPALLLQADEDDPIRPLAPTWNRIVNALKHADTTPRVGCGVLWYGHRRGRL